MEYILIKIMYKYNGLQSLNVFPSYLKRVFHAVCLEVCDFVLALEEPVS